MDKFGKQKLPKFGKSFLFILRDLFFHKNLARYVYISTYFREPLFLYKQEADSFKISANMP